MGGWKKIEGKDLYINYSKAQNVSLLTDGQM